MSNGTKLVPYKREHILPLLEQRSNQHTKALFLSDKVTDLENLEGNFTLFINDVPAVCGGVMKLWEGRGQVWSVFNEDFKKNFVPVFRAVNSFLKDQLKIYQRIEVAIPVTLYFAQRRIEMLGFKKECSLAKKFLPDGQDCTLYALVRE